MARIDAPQLAKVDITFFGQSVFDTPQFAQFITRTPKLKALEKAHVIFDEDYFFGVLFSSWTFGYGKLKVTIPRTKIDRQLRFLYQLCTRCLPHLSVVEHLYIDEHPDWIGGWQDNISHMLWLGLLGPFPAVTNLYLCEAICLTVLPELIASGTTEEWPTLQNIFLEGIEPSGPVHERIQQFVSTWQVLGQTIAVSSWDRDRSNLEAND